ncbi:PREDICTED: solute carrier organic anion transporter family member 1B3 isoform X2 [Chinchilla lanigera]|uniref:solute carrier organic anion transporter family member 1B3 isoform X2 n=1 Tax=Chinchilla lanigera TaxID=34839 RepID=UPI00038EAB23|nr:PREDICTED: solute carrier organic anion transporter family member 1B3 isoform X2 [Chinchilla lanigera]
MEPYSKIFFAALSFTYICKTLGGVIMKTSITQIERRFDISSSVAGLIDGGFEIGNLFVIVFVSYFGSKLHRPKIIGIGCAIMGVGSIMTALPHFFMGYYRYSTETHDNASENSLSTCLTGETSSLTETPTEIVGKGCEKQSESYMWIYVLMGNMIRGIGETPIAPLGISYLDDFAKEGQSSVYLGSLNSLAVFGPILAFTMASVFAKMYVDVGFVDPSSIRITPQDARWVGAWWLGFLVSGLLSIISSIPFFFLPKNPNEPQKKRRKVSTSLHGLKTDQEKKQTANLTNHSQDITLTGFLKSMKSLLTNRLYVLYAIFTLINFSSIIGSFTYIFKYIEQQFGQTASQANVLLGLVALPHIGAGLFLGGYLIRKLKLTIVGIVRFSLFTSCIGFIGYVLNFALMCENKSVAGLTLTHDGLNPVTSHTNVPLSYCNSDCNCDESQWEPVCGENGVTYLSPCLAGCTSRSGTGKFAVFYNCSCLEVSGFPSTNYSARIGECPRDDGCKRYYYIYISVQIVFAFISALGSTAHTIIRMRIVKPDLKALAVGFHSLVFRTLGGILAPIYFGAMIDRTCLKWSTTSCGTRGACRIYDTVSFGNYYLGLSAFLKFVGIALSFLFFYLVKKKYGVKDGNAFENGEKDTNEVNLESSKNNECFVPSATVKETHI